MGTGTFDAADVTQQNRDYWEAIAGDRLGEPVEFFRTGGSALEPPERELIGDPRGLRVLHLACSVGNETLTFAQLGAEVTGVDISPTHIRNARAKAKELGVDVDFREGDMTVLDPEITGFDIVYISYGGICWAPDIDAWAMMVAGLLNADGRVIISEHHPLWEVLSVNGEDQLSVSSDYFGDHRLGYPDPRKAPQVTRGRTEPLPDHTSFVWNLGRVVTALIAAGLAIDALQEFQEPEMFAGLGASASALPGSYLLGAHLPANSG